MLLTEIEARSFEVDFRKLLIFERLNSYFLLWSNMNVHAF